jgi:DNA-binding phage protein
MRVALADREILERVLNVRQILDSQDVLRKLRSGVDRAGSQRAFARKAGVNVSVVSKTLRGQVLPSEKILRALNLRVVYLSR